MKVLLLAAGRGTRISRYLAGNPKCTVDIGGQKLIQYTIELFHKKGITDIAMVLGYRAEVIQETLKDYEGIRYFYNPFFDVTNSIASAWFAKDFLSQYDDTLIMNADVYLEETLLDRILECHKSPVMFADGTRKEEADYKYKYENGLLVKYGKELTGSDITGEYIGIGRFSKDFMPEFMEKLDGMIRTQQHSVWWENILYEMVGKRPVYVEEMDGLFWAEVDYVVKGVDQESGLAAASRLEAMALKRREYYFRTDRDGNYQIYEGIRAEARVISVIRAGIFIDLFGAECYIPLRELSYQRWVDAAQHYQPGQRVLVKVLEVDRSDRSHPRVSASVKQAMENPYEKALKKYVVGNRYVGTVSMVDLNGVFVSLDGGVDCLCTYPKRGRPPRGARATVRILGINHENNRIWGVITHMSTTR